MRKYITALLLTSPAFAVADTSATDASKAGTLSADIELGLLITSGNTKSSSLYGKAKINQDLEKWKNQYVLKSLYKKDRIELEIDGEEYEEERTTAHSSFASLQSDYKLDAKNRSLFVFGSYEKDRFSGYDYQATFAAGYSDRLIDTDTANLDYSVGPGILVSKTTEERDTDGNILSESEKTESGVLHASISYVYNISDSAKFTQNINADIAFESGKNSKALSETALIASLSKSFAMKASYTVNYNSEVPDSKQHSDSQTAITLMYSM